MEWTSTQQQELHRFLAGFTNPDPNVQASNLHQLEALAQHPHALFAVCTLVCDNSSSCSVRLSATAVAQQLLRRQPHLSFYLGSPDGGMDVQTSAHQLMSGLSESYFRFSPAALPAPLQRATSSLIAALLKAVALDSTCSPAANLMWSRLLSYLLHTSAGASLPPVPGDNAQSTSFAPHPQTAALLRELCEAVLTASGSLREWVGGHRDQSLDLCNVLSQQLRLLRTALGLHHELHDEGKTSCVRVLVTWMEDLLAAFSSCMDSGVLPATSPEFLGNICAASGEGPAAQALRIISAAVAQLHTDIQDMTLSLVLRPLASWEGGAGTAATTNVLHRRLQSNACFVAVAMRYLADAVLIEGFDVLNGRFQREAVPLLASFCDGVAAAQLTYDGAGDSDSVHTAVIACVHYAAQLVHVEHFLGFSSNSNGGAYDQKSVAVSYVAYVHRMLISASIVPTSIAMQLDEHTVQEPDSTAEMLVISAAGRRRKHRDAHSSSTLKNSEIDAVDEDLEEAGAEGPAMADALEAQLPDNGTLRQAVAWCASSLTCNPEWMAALVQLLAATPPLLPSALLSDVCRMEAALFVGNEVIDAVLAEKSVLGSPVDTTLQRQLAEQLKGVLPLLSAPASIPGGCADDGGSTRFFLRVQAVRFLGRLGCGLMESWKGPCDISKKESNRVSSCVQWMAQRTYGILNAAGGLEGMLWILVQVLRAEVNKGVQVECVRAITALITNCARTLEALFTDAKRRCTSDASDLEEESLDDDSSISSGGDNGEDDELKSIVPNPNVCAAMDHVNLFCESLGLTSGLAIFPQTLQLISQHFSCVQWSVRQSIYHLLSEALPLLWCVSEQQRQSQLLACGDSTTASDIQPFVRAATAQLLEVLAAHYMALLTDARSSLSEMASLLTCMADIATAMDAAALETVFPWILQVAHHVLNLYAEYLTSTKSNTKTGTPHASSGAVVDMTDMCMVSLDLISCVCDGLLDRDALLVCQLCPQKQSEAAATDLRVTALAAALLNPAAAGYHTSTPSGAFRSQDALPNRCVALLRLCQSHPDHPSRAACPTGTGVLRHADEFGDVRRACFAILYDCVFLLAYTESLFRPSAEHPNSAISGNGITNTLGNDLFTLCLYEVTPGGFAESTASQSTPSTEDLKALSTVNPAASDAWLCLGALLSLWDEQSWWAQSQRRPCAGVPTSLFIPTADASAPQSKRYVRRIVENLLALLTDKKFATMSYLKMNMISAECGLAALLASPLTTCSSPSHAELPYPMLAGLFTVASSTQVREYAPDATRGDVKGVSEAVQILWCLGRVWQDAVQPLPYDLLCGLLRIQGKEIAKTGVWLLRCITVHTTTAALSLPRCPFWASLLKLWRPIAQTLVQAAQDGVIFLAPTQLNALRQLSQL
jgi:hypothetical protein